MSVNVVNFKEFKVTSSSSQKYSRTSRGKIKGDDKLYMVKLPQNYKQFGYWTINEYIGGKIYGLIANDTFASATKLIVNKNSKVGVLIPLREGFHELYPPEKALFPFHCVTGGCVIKHKSISKKTKQQSTYKEKVIKEFELANIISSFLDDQDTSDGNGFAALTNAKDHVPIIRYDFDDSFNFLYVNGIVRHAAPQNIVGSWLVSAQRFFSSYNDAFRKSFIKINEVDKALEKFLSITLKQIIKVVDLAFEDLKLVFSNKDIIRFYKTEKMNCKKYPAQDEMDHVLDRTVDHHKHCKYNKKDSAIDKLKNSIKYFLSRQYDALKDFKICTQVESALINNDVDEAHKVAQDKLSNQGDVGCYGSITAPVLSSSRVGYVDSKLFKKNTNNFIEQYRTQGITVKSSDECLLKNNPFGHIPKNDAHAIIGQTFPAYSEQHHDEL